VRAAFRFPPRALPHPSAAAPPGCAVSSSRGWMAAPPRVTRFREFRAPIPPRPTRRPHDAALRRRMKVCGAPGPRVTDLFSGQATRHAEQRAGTPRGGEVGMITGASTLPRARRARHERRDSRRARPRDRAPTPLRPSWRRAPHRRPSPPVHARPRPRTWRTARA